MNTTLGLCLLASFLAAVTCSSPDCKDASQAFIKFREFYKKQTGDERFQKLVKVVIQYGMVDIEADDEIDQIFCAIINEEPRTIQNIARNNWQVFNSDSLRVAFIHSAVKYALKYVLMSSTYMMQHFNDLLKVYDSIGFPDFPLDHDRSDLSKILSTYNNHTLEATFHWFSHYNKDTFEYSTDMEALVTSLAESDSLEEFMTRAYLAMNGDYADYMTEESVANAVQSMVKDVLSNVNSTRAEFAKNKANLVAATEFSDVLTKSGFLDVTRGGPELFTCDFIANDVIDAVQYVTQIFGRDQVQQALTFMFVRDISVDDTCALKEMVCSILEAKSQSDLASLMTDEVTYRVEFSDIYATVVGYALFGLVNPAVVLEQGMPVITLARMGEKVNFPNFPLSITNAQAKQLAASILAMQPYREDSLESLAKVLTDSQSMEEASQDTYTLYSLHYIMENIGGKTDSVVQLAELVYELAFTLEQHGFFMLPEN